MNGKSKKNISYPSVQQLQSEIDELSRQVKQLERDNQMLSVINRNTEQLRRAYEAEKKLQYLYNDLLLKNCPNMLFLFNENLCFVTCSVSCDPLLCDCGQLNLINRPFRAVFSEKLKDDWVEKVFEHNSYVLKTHEQCRYDDTVVFSDGEYIHVQITISPIIDENKNCRGTLMSVNNVTELIETKRHAEETAHSKSNFLANMSHEIRTPMNAVKGLSELLSRTELNSLQRNYVRNIISSSNSLLGIINDVLDFSKIDANKIELTEEPYDLAEMVTSVCNIVNMRADGKKLSFTVDAPPTLPSCLIGDDVRIKQIITNLLSNAVKYTNEGYVRLIVRTETHGNSLYLVCSVEDSGIGIHKNDIPTLFEAFSRADLHTNRNIVGTGLGLTISKQLAIVMGGDLWVDSVYGKGSSFTFCIPQKVKNPAPIAEVFGRKEKRVLVLRTQSRKHNLCEMLDLLGVGYDTIISDDTNPDRVLATHQSSYTHCIYEDTFPPSLVSSIRSKITACHFAAIKDIHNVALVADDNDVPLYFPLFISELAKFLNANNDDSLNNRADTAKNDKKTGIEATALIVDDNEINLIVGEEMLHSFGITVFRAESGKRALELCDTQKFDLIFMDHMMPEMDGIQTTHMIRAGQGENKSTPIIALTANVVNNMQNYYLNCGMDDFIGKPVEFSDIGRVLDKWLPHQERNQKIERAEPVSATNCLFKVDTSKLIKAMDSTGLCASEVLRELNGDFKRYVSRIENLWKILNKLTDTLCCEVEEERWDAFSRDILTLRSFLFSIGARDSALHARQLAAAANKRDICYMNNEFCIFTGNMFLLEQKLSVIIPMAKGESISEVMLGDRNLLSKCLKKIGIALSQCNMTEAMEQIEKVAAYSLDKNLDKSINLIYTSVQNGEFDKAVALHSDAMANYFSADIKKPAVIETL